MADEYPDLRCRWCGQRFYVCLQCYHGEVYCCEQCAAEGYQAVRDEARARQSGEDGKEDHNTEPVTDI